MSDNHSVTEQACFQFKTSFSPCTIMQINLYDLEQLEAHLIATISRAPNFFIGSALIVDLESIKYEDIDFQRMKKIIIANNMVPVGVRGGSDKQHADAVSAGLPVIAVGRQSAPIKSANAVNQEEAPKPAPTKDNLLGQPVKPYEKTKIVTTPIRSGMQVYAKDADLIVIAPVSVGAELLADGNIHVYGPLRGRALAGVQGNTNARIFCRALEAELVAIAGYYLVKEDMQPLTLTQDATVQIYLANEQVKIEVV